MPLAGHPLHRSGRAALPHPAPTHNRRVPVRTSRSAQTVASPPDIFRCLNGLTGVTVPPPPKGGSGPYTVLRSTLPRTSRPSTGWPPACSSDGRREQWSIQWPKVGPDPRGPRRHATGLVTPPLRTVGALPDGWRVNRRRRRLRHTRPPLTDRLHRRGWWNGVACQAAEGVEVVGPSRDRFS